MFGLFRRKRTRSGRSPNGADQADAAAREALAASLRLGELIRQHPLAILDAGILPLPKAAMKTALRLAWERTKDDKQRAAFESWYLRLSEFQDGVGPKPIDCDPPATADHEKTSRYMNAWLPWAELCQREKWALWVELAELKRKKMLAHSQHTLLAPISDKRYAMRSSA